MDITDHTSKATNFDRGLPLYISTIGSGNERIIYRPSGIEDNLLLYTAGGKGSVYIRGKRYVAQRGSIIYLPAGTTHFYEKISGVWNTYWVSYGGAVNILDSEAAIWEVPEDFDFIHYYNEIIKHKANADWSIKSSTALYELLIRIKTFADPRRTALFRLQNKLDEVTDWLYSHFTEEIDVKEIAALIGVTPEHFCRIFKEYTGKRPFEYLTQLRIDMARNLLLHSDETIAEIAAKTGYSDASYFIKKFREFEGISPGKYRKNILNNTKTLDKRENV